MSKRRSPLAPTADDIRTSFRLDHQAAQARIADAADLGDDQASELDLEFAVEEARAGVDRIYEPLVIGVAIFAYSRHARGFVYPGRPEVYQTQTEAAANR